MLKFKSHWVKVAHGKSNAYIISKSGKTKRISLTVSPIGEPDNVSDPIECHNIVAAMNKAEELERECQS